MAEKLESLFDIANGAVFDTLHSRVSQIIHLMGSVMSDRYHALFFRTDDPRLSKAGLVEIFGIVDPYDYDTCALYTVRREYLEKYIGGNDSCNPGAGGVNIDKEETTFIGKDAVVIIESYRFADQQKRID